MVSAIAALFTRMSMRPNRSSVRRAISSGLPAAATSPGTANARSPERIRDLLRALDVAHVDRDRGAALVEPLRGGTPQSARRAGDDRDAPLEIRPHECRDARPSRRAASASRANPNDEDADRDHLRRREAAERMPPMRSSFARRNSTRNRSSPAYTAHTPNSHPSACLCSRSRQTSRKIRNPRNTSSSCVG